MSFADLYFDILQLRSNINVNQGFILNIQENPDLKARFSTLDSHNKLNI